MYKSVRDLSPMELDELRDHEQWKELPDGTINTESFDDISNEMLFERYAHISFVDDDFFCNQDKYIVEV